MKILLTHTPHMRDNYYGPRALAGLSALCNVVLHQGTDTLEGERLIAAANGCDLIVADRATALPAAIFDALPALKAALRCAVDIRNIDVATASSHGILVTRAKPGFVESVTELVFGFLVDGATVATLDPAEHVAQLWLPWRKAMERTFSPTNREAISQLPRRVLGHTGPA